MFKHKKNIFFDLDHTIWDFDRNAQETLKDLYFTYRFDELFNQPTADLFLSTYTRNNHQMWDLYHHGKIDKETLRKLRFANTFIELGVDPALFPMDFEEEYLEICPTKTNLFPHAHETLAYLKDRYHLHLITNGFKEACEKKLLYSDLAHYFKTIVISELVGVNKPHPQIFEHAIDQANTTIEFSIMIGDNLDADIRGAQNYGIDAIYFNPLSNEKPADIHFSINSLKELQELF